MAAWLLLVLSLVLIAVCGVFVAGEFALLTADRATVERAAEAGDRKARGVLAALRNLSVELSGVQVAITVTNLAVGFLSEPALAGLLEGPLKGIGISGDAVSAVAVGLALVVSTLLTMLFGEMVPKNLAIAMPVAVARAVQAPVRGFSRAVRGPLRALNGAANAILALFGMQAREELPSARSPEELVSLVRHSARAGTLAPGTATLLVRSLSLGERRARDVLTARPQMVTVAAADPVSHVIDVIRRTGHSRLPVTGAHGLDEIVGIVELDHVVAVPAAQRSGVSAASVMRPTVEVPESLPMDAVLQTLQNRRSQLAIVVDEYGGTAGLLSAEDILEEIVGDIDDEHDDEHGAPEAATRTVPEGFEISGLLRPDEVAATTGHALPASGRYETVGGLLMHLLGRIPEPGDRVEVAGVTLTVLRMAERRVDRVLLSPPTDATSDDKSDDKSDDEPAGAPDQSAP